ncbi:putative DNA-directed DNA polymerase [Phytophthora infestans]|nr:putative DNA-directed DNA polymerase [Phytophthora infestans]
MVRGQRGGFKGDRGAFKFTGQCYECNQYGHKQNEYPRSKQGNDGDEFVFAATRESTTSWLLDSGASAHMTHNRSDFVEFRELDGTMDIVVASGQRLRAVGVGTVRFQAAGGCTIKVTDVLLVPDLDRRLLSIPSLVAKGVSVGFSSDGCTITFDGKLVARVEKRDKLFVWNVVASSDVSTATEVAASADV